MLFKAHNFVEKREGLKQTKYMTYMPFDGEIYVYYGGSFALIGLTMTTSSMAAFYETYKTKPNTAQPLVINRCITFHLRLS